MGPSCWDASESQGHRSHKENPLHSRYALREQAARESVVCSHSPFPAAGAPIKTCFNSLSSLWSIFIDWGRLRILVSIRLNGAQHGAVVERIWAPPGHWNTFPSWVTSGQLKLLIQCPRVWWVCPLGSLVPSLGQCFPLLLVLLPLLASLYSSFLCPLLLCPFLSREWTLDSYSITPLSLWDHAPSGWQWLTLTGDKQRWERLASYQQVLPGFSQICENNRSLNLILCSGWNPIVPVFSPLFSCWLSLFFSLTCPSSLYLSFDRHTYNPISFILKTSCLWL